MDEPDGQPGLATFKTYVGMRTILALANAGLLFVLFSAND